MDTTLSRTDRVWAYLQLLRPANVVTAWADVLAGGAVAGVAVTLSDGLALPHGGAVAWLLAATTGLYGGGIVLNDVFDAPVDAEERPERPLPSGRASRVGAAVLGSILLLLGIGAASQVTVASGLLAAGIAGGAVAYDAWANDHVVLGPLTMGLCRGGNLLLGVSLVPTLLTSVWYLVLIPVAYVAAITAVGQGEVHGGTHRTGYVALGLVGIVLGALLSLGLRGDYEFLYAVPFVIVVGARVLPPFVRAARSPEPAPIQKAVKAGVTSIIPLNAVLAAGFGGWAYGLVVLALLPLSMGLARLFAVT
ncbi:MAG: UbiA-like protein EboC [Salinibacter sp.]